MPDCFYFLKELHHATRMKENNTEKYSLSSHVTFFLVGPDPGEQQDHHHPRQGPQPSDQAAASLPVQEHAEGNARQHAQEPARAAHPRE